MPPHILLTFDGETAEEAVANNDRRMYIFPTQAYIDMYNAQGNSVTMVLRFASETPRAEA